MGVVGEAFVLIRPKVSSGTFAREAEQGGLASGMAHVAKRAAEIFAVAFAAHKLFDFGKSAVEEAALTQKATENIRNQFKGVAKDVLAFNSDAARNFGISTSAADAFSSQIGLVGTNLGLTKRQTGDMAVGLEKLAGSVGLIKGQDPASYFTALQSALLGNTRGLKQMGISVDTTREKQYLLSQGLIKSKNDAITPALKAQAIYGIATQHLGKFMDEARKHSGDLADSQIKLKAEFANVKEEIGTALLPVVTRVATALAQYLPTAIEYTSRAIKAVSPVIKSIADAVVKYIGEAVSYVRQHWPQIRAFIIPIMRTISTNVRGALAEIEGFWRRHGAQILAVARQVFHGILAVVKDVMRIIADVVRFFLDIIHGRWGSAGRELKNLTHDIFHAIVGIIRNFGPLVLRAVVFLGTQILHGLEKVPDLIWRAVYSIGRTIVNGIIHGVGSLGSALKNTVESHIQGALSSLNPFSPIEHGAQLYISNPIMSGTTKGLDPFKAKLQAAIIPTLRDVLTTAHDQGVTLATAVGTGISTGTVSGLATLRSLLTSTVIGAVSGALSAARSHFGIRSPSSVWAAQLGQPLRDGIVHGMGGLEQMLVSKVTRSVQAAQTAASGFGGGATPTGSAATGANQRLGMQMMLAHGWPASQWGALQALWNRESGWNQYAKNPSSGAYGIPQSLPASKMASAGADWMTNPATQIRWGLGYISGRYGSPGAAWAHELSAGWYKHGGVAGQGLRIAGEAGPELVASGSRVSSATDTRGMFDRLTAAIDQLTKRLDQMQRPSIGEFHMHTPALSGEGAAYDALNALTRKVAPV